MDQQTFLRYFSCDNITGLFPYATKIRTGVLLIYNGKLLLVREKSSGNISPPKGLVNWARDRTVFDAALRKLNEETGINLKNTPFDVCSDVYIYSRQYCNEVIIYFTAYVNSAPSGYSGIWADLSQCLYGKFQSSKPSKAVFREIDNSISKARSVLHFDCYQKAAMELNHH